MNSKDAKNAKNAKNEKGKSGKKSPSKGGKGSNKKGKSVESSDESPSKPKLPAIKKPIVHVNPFLNKDGSKKPRVEKPKVDKSKQNKGVSQTARPNSGVSKQKSVTTTGSAGGARTRPSTGNKGNLTTKDLDKNQWVIYYNDADGKINSFVTHNEELAK